MQSKLYLLPTSIVRRPLKEKTTHQHTSPKVEPLEELRDEDVCRDGTVYINFFYLLEDIYKPFKALLVACGPDEIYLLAFDLEPEDDNIHAHEI